LVGWITSFAGRRPTTRLPLKSLVQNESSGSIVAILSQKKGREIDRLLERPSPFKTRDQQFPFAPAMSLVGTRLPGSCSNLQRRPAAELDKGSGTAGLSRQIAAEARARLGRDGAPHSRLGYGRYPRKLGGSEGPVVAQTSRAGRRPAGPLTGVLRPSLIACVKESV
jgi:hypothetical protein